MSSRELRVRQISGNDSRYYRLGRKLGEGGFGAVYEAERLQARQGETKLVACKVVKVSSNPGKLMYQQRELEIWYKACQNARHVAIVYDAACSQTDALAYIYMELLPGGDTWKLSDKIQANRDWMHPLLLSIIAYQTACGLYEIHSKGIQHRDLKPDNILLTKKITARMNKALWELQKHGRPSSDHREDLVALWNNILGESRLAVLTDFGLARDHTAPVTSHGRLTKAGGFSPAYHAPEMVENNIQSRQADIFSFGMVIYILASFHFPNDAADRRDLPKTYPASLQNLYLKCTHDSPTRRPEAGAVMSELSSIKNAEQAKISKLYTAWQESERQAAAATSSRGGTARAPQAQGGAGGWSAEHQRLLDAEMEQMRRERERSARKGGGGGGTGGITQGMGRLRVDDRAAPSSSTRYAGYTPYAPPPSGARHVRPEDVPRRAPQRQPTRTGGAGSSRDRVIEVYRER